MWKNELEASTACGSQPAKPEHFAKQDGCLKDEKELNTDKFFTGGLDVSHRSEGWYRGMDFFNNILN